MDITRKLLSLALNKKGILLDIDNTVYRYDPCHKKAQQAAYELYKELCEPISKANFERACDTARKQIKTRTKNQAASHSRLLYFQRMLENRFGCTCYKESLKLERIYWQTFLKVIKLEPWVMPFLKEIRRGKLKVAFVTDLTAEIQMRKLDKLGLSAWTDFLVSSEEAGIEKPDPKIFQLALKKINCSPKEVLLIGDNKKRDVFKGMTTFYV